jgi:hypothetical protein
VTKKKNVAPTFSNERCPGVFTVFLERNWIDSIVSSVKRFKTVGAVNVLVGESRRGKMADRERSSSPSFAGQRTTAGGLGVPPAQQVKPGAINPLKKSQNYAAKAAAARLAKVMQASRDSVDDDDDEDDDHHFPHFGPDGSNARDLSPKLMRAYDSSNGPLAAGLRSATFARSTLKPTPVPPLVPVNPRPRPALAVVPSVLRVKDPAPAPVIDRTRR